MEPFETTVRPWSDLDFDDLSRRFAEDDTLCADPVATAAELLLPTVPFQWGMRVAPKLIDYESEPMITMEVPAGAVAVDSGLAVHDTPPILSDKLRVGLLCGYHGAHTRLLRED